MAPTSSSSSSSSSRAPALAPLNIGGSVTQVGAGEMPMSADSVGSDDYFTYYGSVTSPSVASTSTPLRGRTGSSGSSGSADFKYMSSSPGEGATPTRRVKSPKVNANSYCGRHSTEFLFGGKGFGDMWRAVTHNGGGNNNKK